MALTVGTDTYISLADADEYLASRRLSTDAGLVAWNALSDADREVLLRQALEIIDRQPLRGYRETVGQVLEFPRYLYTDGGDPLLTGVIRYNDPNYISVGVPEAVGYAQAEIALALIDDETSSSRRALRRAGVRSYRLGQLSESLSGTPTDIPSEKAARLLAPYIAGGFPIC